MTQNNPTPSIAFHSQNSNSTSGTSYQLEKANYPKITKGIGEIEKEDLHSKNNKLENLNKNNKNMAAIPFQKYHSSDNIDKNNNNENFTDEANKNNENSDDPNPFALTQKKISGKKIPHLFVSLNEFAYINDNNNELSVHYSVISKKEDKNYGVPFEELKKNLFQKDIGMTCLKDCGNTSYLNTILQCLGNIECLKNYFLDSNNFEYMKNNIEIFPLSFTTSRIFYHFYEQKDKLYSLDPFLQALGRKNKIYNSKSSRNSNECLIYILDTLHNELNRIKEKNEKTNYNKSDRNEVIEYGIINYKNSYDSIISDIFNWFEIKELHCIECDERNYSFKTYNTYQFNISNINKKINKNNITIYDCLNYDIIKNQKLYCSKCRKKSNYGIITGIFKSPKIFVFLLNDGEYNEELLNVKFILEENINLNKFIEDKKAVNKFELFGIISICVNNKKYNCFCKSFTDNQWYYYYDEKVMQVNINQIEMENCDGHFIPNILFYKAIEK